MSFIYFPIFRWEYSRHFAKDGDPILVWQAATRDMNPTIPQSLIDEAYEADESSALAEYGGQFRKDVETFVSREAVDVCTVPNRFELPYLSEHQYVGFVDPSGGSQDSMTLAIAHTEGDDGDRAVLDLVREVRPPFSPDFVLKSSHRY